MTSCLTFIVGFLLLSSSLTFFVRAASTCTPANDYCWPTVEEWNRLNTTVNGNLIAVAPPAQSCYPGPSYNLAQCNAFRESATDMVRRESYVGAMQYTNWEGCGPKNSCTLPPPTSSTYGFPNITSFCHQGALPRYALNSDSPVDMATVIQFAQERHIALNIKNTGHDFAGKSTSPDSITIWTHGLQKIEYHDGFQPDQCTMEDEESFSAMTLGAGVNWGDAYAAAEEHKVTLVGGAQPGVGAAGGWLLGGGHSILAPTFGLGVDQVLQFKLVLANGNYITVNKCQYSDLFWALRGGGVGAFGVVTEVTVRTHPYLEHLQTVDLSVNFTSFEAQKAYNLEMARLASSFAEARWGGFVRFTSKNSSAFILATPVLRTTEDAIRSMQPIIDFLEEQKKNGDVQNHTWSFNTYQGFQEFFIKVLEPLGYPVGLNTLLSSRLIPREILDDNEKRQRLTDAMMNGLERITKGIKGAKVQEASVSFFPVTPVGVPDEGSQETSVTPAWRNSLWHVIFNLLWEDADEKVDDEYANRVAQGLTAAADSIRELIPNSGAYINEADVLEPSWQDSFWGRENYQKLLEIKRKYDPDTVFHCWKCVGWDESIQEQKYRCYEEYIHD